MLSYALLQVRMLSVQQILQQNDVQLSPIRWERVGPGLHRCWRAPSQIDNIEMLLDNLAEKGMLQLQGYDIPVRFQC